MIIIDGFAYDLMISGSLTFESEVTDNPVEVGANTTDHIRPLPVEFTVESIVSDTPLADVLRHESRNADEITAAFGSALPSEQAYANLLRIRDERRVVTIEAPRGPGRKVFTNMALQTLTINEDATTTGGLHFSATFKQINFVTNRRVTIRTAIPGGKRRRQSKAKPGNPTVVRNEMLWRMGAPPGAIAGDDRPWAYVKADFTSFNKKEYIYTGYASANAPARAMQADLTLNRDEILAFEKDMDRDMNLKRVQQQRDLVNALPTTSEPPTNLPSGFDVSHFQTQSPGGGT